MADFDVLKDIPGYKAILKAVLKNQIQMLVEQLSEQTGEESVILTASLSDGTLSHLGSESGKFFLEGHDEIKSQFLGFCLKRHHKRKSEETLQVPQPKRFAAAAHSPTDFSRTSPGSDIYSSSHSLSFNATSVHPVALTKTKRKQLAPNRTKSIRQNIRHGSPDVVSLTPDMSSQKESGLDMTTSITELNNADYVSDSINRTDHGKSEENRMKLKTEAVDFEETAKDDTDEGIAETKRTEDSGDGSGETVNDDTVTAIKVEATEDDDDLEITGVEGEVTDHVTDFSQSLSDRELYLQSLPGAEGQGPNMEAKQYNLYAQSDSPSGTRGGMSYSPSLLLTNRNYVANRSGDYEGLIVTRGGSRVEKLIKCDSCGNVYRTSNMARHKKRYCKAIVEKQAKQRQLCPYVTDERIEVLGHQNSSNLEDYQPAKNIQYVIKTEPTEPAE